MSAENLKLISDGFIDILEENFPNFSWEVCLDADPDEEGFTIDGLVSDQTLEVITIVYFHGDPATVAVYIEEESSLTIDRETERQLLPIHHPEFFTNALEFIKSEMSMSWLERYIGGKER